MALGWLVMTASPARADVVTRGCAGGNSCTSNDVRISKARALGNPPPCNIGDKVTFTLVADLVSTATERYDVGVFLSPDGGSAQTGQTCEVGDLPHPPADNADGDVCGDISKSRPLTGDKAVTVGTFEVECQDSNHDGLLDVDSCLTWAQNGNSTCSGAADVNPGAPSKCRCEPITITNIHIACGGQDCSSLSDECNDGVCNTTTDQCEKQPKVGGSCGGDLCNNPGTCDANGQCQPGTAISCDDNNPCTDDSCNPQTGCVHTNNTAQCGGDQCTGIGTCQGGSCVTGPPANCNDNNPCTDDSCNAQTGCVHTNNTAQCGGDQCTGIGTCQGGSCVAGQPLNCDDGNGCTDDSCNPQTGCVHTNNTAPCDDNTFCNGTDTCQNGTCSHHSGDPCAGGAECNNVCNEAAKNCQVADNTPCTDDQNACTKDVCTGGTCTHDPTQPSDQVTDQSARAYGLTLRLGGSDVPLGAPDTGTVTDTSKTASLADIDQLDPLLKLHLMDETATAGGGHSEADSETANVKLLNTVPLNLPLPPVYLVEASAVESKVVCDATVSGAACSDAGSHIANLKILGIQYGDVTPNNRPQPVNVKIPGLGKVTVAIFEEETSGANAGIPQPQNQQNHADLKLNAIHVNITLGNNEVIDLVVAHAEGSATTGPICTEAAHVSGRGLVAGATLCTEDGKPCDQFVDDPSNQLVNELKGLVDLPAGGGSQSTSVDVGPLPDTTNSPSLTLVKADAGTSQTDGTVSGNDAQSHTLTRVAQADIIQQPAGAPAAIHLGVIQTECHSTTAGGGSSTGTTTIADATIGGQDLCTALGLNPAPCALGNACCNPPVNTDLCKDTPLQPILQPICDGLGLKLLLNEQTGTQTGNPTDITVNGVHVIAKTPLTLNADAKVSSSHCDAESPAAQ